MKADVAVVGSGLAALVATRSLQKAGRNLLLPTAIGTPKPSCLYPESMAAGDLGRDEPIVLCGFEGYEDFVPELAASNLSRSWGAGDQSVRAIRVSLPGFDPGKMFTSIDIARNLENDAFRREVAQQIRGKATR